MAARHVSALLALGIAVSSQAVLLTGAAFAQEQPEEKIVPQVDNAKHQFVGEINDNSVFARSGPSNNSFYPTIKLKKGDRVTVVGIKYDWLKVLPPEGSFSYVPQAYVTRRGDGKVGRVNQTANVRAGSALVPLKTAVQMKLDEGKDVTILGEQDEYFKIVPPEGAYLYVNQQYVDPVRPEGAPAIAGRQKPEQQQQQPEAVDAPREPELAAAEESPSAELPGSTTGDESVEVSSAPTDTEQQQGTAAADADAGDVTDPAETQPAAGRSATADATATPSKLTPNSAAEEFGKLEAEFEKASQLSLVDQPVEQLTQRYDALAKSGLLGGTTRKVIDARLIALKMRSDAREELLAFRQKKEEAQAKMLALQEERKEIDERIAQTQVDLFTAVGTLRVSSLQRGAGGPLYRLTDPATGRTIVYIRSGDPKYAQLMNQFVGVRGSLRTDERLKMKIITPTDAEPVEQAKVNNTVIATITPPSMLPPANATVDQEPAAAAAE